MSDHDQSVAANLLDPQFTANAANQRWVGDTEYRDLAHRCRHDLGLSMRAARRR
jgi:transposase InsO family protein